MAPITALLAHKAENASLNQLLNVLWPVLQNFIFKKKTMFFLLLLFI